MIELRELTKEYENNKGKFKALDKVSIKIEDGDIYGIIGMSGAGKSTLVKCINTLEHPTSGEILVDGANIHRLDKKELRKYLRSISMIFQGFNLLMQKTALENVCFPMYLAGVKKKDAIKKANELLDLVGLKDKASSYPSQLSGGQKQRVAIARALSTNPKILLLDEATSALDPKSTADILKLIKTIHEKFKITVIVITHQMDVLESICHKVSILDSGRVVESGTVSRIFSNPETDIAKSLVFPERITESLPIPPGECHLRLVFKGEVVTNTPVISNLAMKTGIAFNILSANTKTIEGRAVGNMLLGIKGSREDVDKAIDFIRSQGDVIVQEVSDNVQ